jgi:DNA (cytosine-5)-methyltransferase 1
MNELALFAGAGGGILGGLLLGWRTVCAVEFDEHARNVLIARQNDGSLEPFPIWDDVRSFDGKPWCGIVDVVSGGFPCQDISIAGKGKGIDGERSGLWGEFARVIREVRPRFVLVENSPALTFRGLGRVLGDLAEIGYNARWDVVSAASVGAVHLRERIWICAYLSEGVYAKPSSEWQRLSKLSQQFRRLPWSEETMAVIKRGDDGVSEYVDERNSRCGNAQVPGVVQKAWHVLCQEIGPKKE